MGSWPASNALRAPTGLATSLLGFLRRHWIVLPVLALALYLRVRNLDPLFLYGDDAEYAAVARSLADNLLYLDYPNLQHWDPKPFVSQPPVVLYIMAFSIMMFGATAGAVVGVSVLLGTLTIAVVYGIGHLWRGRTTGIAAAVILAVMPYHVSMSRKAYLDAGFAFFMALAILAILWWSRERTTKRAVYAGIATGLALFSKLPGVLILPVIVAFVTVEIAALWWLGRRDRAAPGALATTLKHTGMALLGLSGVVLVYLLVIFVNGAMDDLYYKLLWQMGRVSPEALPPEVLAMFQQELTQVDRPWTWYFTNKDHGLYKLVGDTTLFLAAAGLLYAAVELFWKGKRENVLLLLWGPVVLAFFATSARKEWFYLTPLMPAIAVLAGSVPGVVFDTCSHLFVKARDAWHRPVAAVAVVLSLLAVSAPTYSAAEYSSTHFDGVVFGAGYEEAAAYIDENGRPGSAQIGNLLGRFTLYWYNERVTYDWYMDHQTLERLIEIGQVQYIVIDNYLPLDYQDGYFEHLITKYHAQPVKRVQVDWGVVEVWEFHPEKKGTAP